METKKSGRIFNRYFVLLFITSVCFCCATEMLNVVLPLYVTEDLGKTAAVSGLMTTFYTITSAVSRPVNGLLTDKLSRRLVMAVGCALYAAGIFLCGFIPMLATAFACRMVQGVGYSAASTANVAASNDVAPKEKLNEAVGYFGISHTLPALFGPIIVTTLIAHMGNRSTQYVIAAVCGVAAVLALITNYEKKPQFARELPPKEEKKGAFIEKTALVPSLIQFGSLFFTSSLMVFATLFFTAWELPMEYLSAYLTTTGVSLLLVRALLSRFLGKVNPLVLLLPAWVAGIAQCLLLPTVDSMASAIAMGVLFGCVHGIVWMTNGALAVNRAAPQRRGAANATFYLAFDAAIGLGAAAWGALIDAAGYVTTYRVTACGYGVMMVLAVIAFARRKREV